MKNHIGLLLAICLWGAQVAAYDLNAYDDFSFFGIEANTSLASAKQQVTPLFRDLAKRYHPQVIGNSEANNRRMQNIQEAYDRIRSGNPRRDGQPFTKNEFGEFISDGASFSASFRVQMSSFSFEDILYHRGRYSAFLQWLLANQTSLSPPWGWNFYRLRRLMDGRGPEILRMLRSESKLTSITAGLLITTGLLDLSLFYDVNNLNVTYAVFGNILTAFLAQRFYSLAGSNLNQDLLPHMLYYLLEYSRKLAPEEQSRLRTAFFQYDLLKTWLAHSEETHPESSLRNLKAWFSHLPLAATGLLIRFNQGALAQPFASVLERDFKAHPEFWLATLRAGLESGELPPTLSEQLENQRDWLIGESWVNKLARAPARMGQWKDAFCEVYLSRQRG